MNSFNNMSNVVTPFSNKIGFSTNIYQNPENLDSLLNDVSNHFNVIEIELEHGLKNLLNYKKENLTAWANNMLKIKKNNNLSFSMHAPYLGETTDIAANDESIRKFAVKTMMRTLEIAHMLNVKTLTCHPGYIDKAWQADNKMLHNLNSSLDILATYAKKLNITIALENTGNHRSKYITLDYEQHIKLCEMHGIGITLDLVHYTSFNPMQEDYFHQLKELLPYIKNIHFADMKIPYHTHLPLGYGDFPYHTVLSFLYQQGYEGNAIIEETVVRYPKEKYLEQAFLYKEKLRNNTVENHA